MHRGAFNRQCIGLVSFRAFSWVSFCETSQAAREFGKQFQCYGADRSIHVMCERTQDEGE